MVGTLGLGPLERAWGPSMSADLLVVKRPLRAHLYSMDLNEEDVHMAGNRTSPIRGMERL